MPQPLFVPCARPAAACRFEPLHWAVEFDMTLQPVKLVLGPPLARIPCVVWLSANMQIGVGTLAWSATAALLNNFACPSLSVVSPKKPTTWEKKSGTTLEIVTR